MCEKNIIQSLWIGPSLTKMEILSIQSFLVHGHEYHLYIYDKIANIPASIMKHSKFHLKDGEDILPKTQIFRYSMGPGQGSVSAFSNIFRYKLLRDKGNYWVDTDMICLNPFNFEEDYVFSSEMVKYKKTINAGVIKVPKGDPFAQQAFEYAQKQDKKTLQWGEIGPTLVSRLVHKLGYEKYVQEPYIFCPIAFKKLKKIIAPLVIKEKEQMNRALSASYGIHLWNEGWRRNQIDKNGKYPNSLYEMWHNSFMNRME